MPTPRLHPPRPTPTAHLHRPTPPPPTRYYRWAVGLASDEPLPDVEKIKASAGRPHQRESVSGEHKHVELQPEEALPG